MSRKSNRLKVSDKLGERYRILSILGSGGMGEVYLAEDLKLKGKRWAIKEAIKSPQEVQQFIDEAEMLIKLNHPYLPNIIDYFPPDAAGYSYLVMDYIEGQSLLQLFEGQNKKLPYDRILHYSIQLCELFTYLHQFEPKPIIYRDLKPANVMIDQQDNVRLIDFGIARNYKLGQQSDTMPLGTIGFAAPEQFEELQTDHRTDLYNLGAMMYFLLSSGHYYYLTQKSIKLFSNELPEGLVQVIDTLLQVHPDDRFQSAMEVKRAMESHPGPEELLQPKKTSKKPLQHKTIVIGGLYPGAGSTFLSIALARVLNRYQLPNALVEYPVAEPELYALLNGEQTMPKYYSFLIDQLFIELDASQRKEWVSGMTQWYPLNPSNPSVFQANKWSTELSYRLLYSVKCPVIIIDVSDKWEDESVRNLCMEADEVIFVATGYPHKYNTKQCQNTLEYALELKDLRKSIHFVANRLIDDFSQREWMSSFPWSPICSLPNIPYEAIIQSAWKGKLVQDQPDILLKLSEALFPILKKIIPKPYLATDQMKMKKPRSSLKWMLAKPSRKKG